MTLYVQRTRISSVANCEGVEADFIASDPTVNRYKVPKGEAISEQDAYSVYLKNDDSDCGDVWLADFRYEAGAIAFMMLEHAKDKARCQVKLEWVHYEGSEKRGAYPMWSLYVGTVWLATLVDEWDGYWTVSGSVVNIDDTLDHLPSRWDEVDLPQLKEKVEQAMIAELTRC